MMARGLVSRVALGIVGLTISFAVANAQQTGSVHQAIARTDENSRLAHQQLLTKTKQGVIDIYFIGDSITRRWGATDYPHLLAHWKKTFHGWNAANFAWGGDSTHNILWRLQNGELDGVVPKVFVVQAGTNNLPWTGPPGDDHIDDVVGGINAIVDLLRDTHPKATIILTGLFPRKQNPELTPAIESINSRLAALSSKENIRYLNINDNLTDTDGNLRSEVSSDGLHLELPGYEVWAAALQPRLTEVLGAPSKEDRAPPPTGDPSVTNRVDSAADPRSNPTTDATHAQEPVVFTTREDHQNMLDQLGITRLRPGRNGNAEAENGANYDEAKANPYPILPDLLKTKSGHAVMTAEQWWSGRRGELVDLLETELYGRIPDNVPDVSWKVLQTREVTAGDEPAIQHEILGVVDNSKCESIEVQIRMSLTLPKNSVGPVPVLMSFGWTPFEIEAFRRPGFNNRGPNDAPRPPSKRDLLIAAGWGCATLNPGSVQDDSGGWQPRRFGPGADPGADPTGAGLTRGIIGLTNCGQPRKPDQWGALRAWGWGASRALDYLESVAEVDSKRVGIAGVSRYGKAALVTMAFDQRFDMGLIASSGAGGTALHRRDFGESPENLAASGEYHWMAGNYLKFSAEESSFGKRTADDLSIDSHAAIALCAPRRVFISHGIPERGDALWLDHQGSFMAAIAAQSVFRLLGVKDLGRSDDYTTESMPAVNVDLLDGALAWRQHDGGHTDEPNVEHFIRWAETQWNGASEGNQSKDDGANTTDQRRLKDAVGNRFKIGVGVSHQVLQNPKDADLIRKHFQILTPENCMKPQEIHPAEDAWNFERTDSFANFARQHNLELVGHCLVWAKDDRTDAWMMSEKDKPVSKETLLRRIEDHVRTVVTRYADVTTMWDVVNEAIGDSSEGVLRDSVYSRTADTEFIVTAFKVAKECDPDALLIYNDYNGHKPEKRRKLIELLTELKRQGAPVDAYGMQGHFELGDDSLEQLRETFDALRNLDLKVVVSELDIDVVKRGRWWADDGKYREELENYDPYKDGMPEDLATQQAEQYVQLFQLFADHEDIIERVSFWNLHDGQSWLNYFPWQRVNHPLLFDRQRAAKPAFTAVYNTLTTLGAGEK